MEQYALSMDFGINFEKILSEPYVNGVMLTLGISDKNQIMEAYAEYLHKTIIESIENREDVFLLQSRLVSSGEDEKASQDTEDEELDKWSGILEEENYPDPDFVSMEDLEDLDDVDEFHEWKEDYDVEFKTALDLIKDNLEEVALMDGWKVKSILLKEDFPININNLKELLPEDAEVLLAKSFEEDSSYETAVPYKIILINKEKEEKTILGGF